GDAFGDHRAVVKLENGQPLQRIEAGDRFSAMLQIAHIHRHQRHAHSLLRQENAHTPRVRSPAAIIQLHRLYLPLRCTTTWFAATTPSQERPPPQRSGRGKPSNRISHSWRASSGARVSARQSLGAWKLPAHNPFAALLALASTSS